MDLRGKTAVITGASSGIGEAVARTLAAAGMNLVLTARRKDRLQALAVELGGCAFRSGDITDPELPKGLIELAVSTFRSCDVVVNNAGMLEVAPLEQLDIERVCEMVRVNVEAAYRMAYEAIRHFQSAGSGHLVNTSSVMGIKTRPTAGWYAGTKYALEGLSEALRMELAGTDVQVSCIEPGLVYTELHNHWEVHPKDLFNVKAPLMPEDIARCVRFILEQPPHVRIPKMLVLPGEHSI